jgi:hypothetical protein
MAAAADMGSGPCHRCGAADHMAMECYLSSKVTCGVCDKAGHVREACWEVDPTLRPAWAGAGLKEGSRSAPGIEPSITLLPRLGSGEEEPGSLTK